MKRRLFCAVLCLALALGLSTQAFAAESAADVTVDGELMTNFKAEIYDGTAYISLYGATLALRPDAQVFWQDDRMAAQAEGLEMSARIGDAYMEVNGRVLYISGGVKADEAGDTLVPARVLAKALGAQVTWDQGVVLTGGGEPLESGETFYNADDLDLLARVITHESGNQPLNGKIAVGNVILNRVASPSFPNSVYDVLFQKNQFPGATDAVPNSESILAAKLCLDGAAVVPGAYWFNGVGKACWASRSKDLVATIGGHAFYG